MSHGIPKFPLFIIFSSFRSVTLYENSIRLLNCQRKFLTFLSNNIYIFLIVRIYVRYILKKEEGRNYAVKRILTQCKGGKNMNCPLRIAFIPSYEPTHTLIDLLLSARQAGFVTIVVNDGSGQNFDGIFNTVSEKSTVLTHNENLGKGRALKTGFKY